MRKEQYLKIIEREIQRVNKIIDAKIIKGLDYKSEARIHKQLIHKIRQHKRKGLWGNFLNSLSNRFPQLSKI
jgi:hypothetical protein